MTEASLWSIVWNVLGSLFSTHWPYLIVFIFPIFRAICFLTIVPKVNGEDGWLAFFPGGYDYLKARAAGLPGYLALISFLGEIVVFLFVMVSVFIHWKTLHILISNEAAKQAGQLAELARNGVLIFINILVTNLSRTLKILFILAIVFGIISILLNFFYWVRIAKKAANAPFVGVMYMLSWAVLLGVYLYTNGSRWTLLFYIFPIFILLYLAGAQNPIRVGKKQDAAPQKEH
jgi:hypothetical protein